ncbi:MULTISPECIES: hypothetical protein [unclassified Halorubrum]|uniref:hypothetical protein n=1 Tax=unclassified Halorubrum TaxID=2642239 RepID=UPI0011C3AD13|nr:MULTISPECIES: hypothetical protein [unclassified Halorubrum]
MIYEEDEDAANQNLMFRCMINSLRHELKMWIDLNKKSWDKAWDALVDSQTFAKSAISAHETHDKCNVREYIEKLEKIEETVFPSQNFNSPEIYVEKFTCTICEDDYSDCDHIAGNPYWGRFCQRQAENIMGMRGAALVDNPKDKKARLQDHVTDDGMIRDQMTWEKREMTEEEKEKYEGQTEDHFVFRATLMTADDTPTDFRNYFPE